MRTAFACCTTSASNLTDEPRTTLSMSPRAAVTAAPFNPGAEGPRTLTILHFNDVYEIDPRLREPVGGVARFVSLVDRFESEDPCIIFSGDFLAPSLRSTETHGMHMIPFMNRLGIKASVLGNHDFDHGLEHTIAAMAASNFPFLLSNVLDLNTGVMLAGALETLVIEHAGIRIGFMGLIEEEWLATLPCIDPSHVAYTDYVAVARELEPRLRADGCELVIALTHSRVPNDERLARECPFLDLILGGHDHNAFRRFINGVPVVKSGTDFRELTRVVIKLPGAPADSAATVGEEGAEEDAEG
eukprot:CAMPEP_0179961718 /NCGR_PEP_ID=MMETSP0983-20121128/29838_1 /TAXON_ID=483367 /ORGANISM="non described non described, Strain CCMP 2436" /LENGTH=300 /DNA_ID=CAMNT_0021874183 /DNA_START=100 /DNA_END=999 /DNA_ORIENTATION=+